MNRLYGVATVISQLGANATHVGVYGTLADKVLSLVGNTNQSGA
jgi:hypothetical protein